MKPDLLGMRPDISTSRERRRSAFLDAAEALFLEQGYDRIGLADIVKRSGGSLATLYELFGSKQGLLQAIAGRWRDEALGNIFESDADGIQGNADLLREYARHRAASMGTPRAIALMRMLVSEGLCDRSFALQTYADLHLPVVAELAGLFAEWNTQGTAKIDNPEAAAEFFILLVAGNSMLSALAGVETDALDEEQVQWRLDLFFAQFKIR